MAKLVLKIADVAVNEFGFGDEPMTIGRDNDNDILLDDAVVSAHHARVTMSTDASGNRAFLLEDLNSKNGTRVNGKEVRRIALKEGDSIQIGRSTLFVVDDTAVAPTPSQS